MMNNENMNTYMKERYRKRRLSAIEYLGEKCNECGSLEDLHFHHKDPQNKSFTLAKAASFSEERWWNEVDKCILLCGTCHSNHHASIAQCGTPQRYWRGCRCDLCKAANTEYSRLYKSSRSTKKEIS
jgi:hypothetical protein